jgi:hypothetical protein
MRWTTRARSSPGYPTERPGRVTSEFHGAPAPRVNVVRISRVTEGWRRWLLVSVGCDVTRRAVESGRECGLVRGRIRRRCYRRGSRRRGDRALGRCCAARSGRGVRRRTRQRRCRRGVGYAASRRDSRAGMSGWAIERKHHVTWPTVNKALTTVWPPPPRNPRRAGRGWTRSKLRPPTPNPAAAHLGEPGEGPILLAPAICAHRAPESCPPPRIPAVDIFRYRHMISAWHGRRRPRTRSTRSPSPSGGRSWSCCGAASGR